MINKIRDKIICNKFEPNIIYLINKFSSESGFFILNSHLLFIAKNHEYDSIYIETDYLSLKTNIHLTSIDNAPSFEVGSYNIIEYKGDVNSPDIDCLIRLCISYAENIEMIGFQSFFNSIINLFQIPRETYHNNLIGLFGELKFIEISYKNYNCNLSASWHNMTKDKYDFVTQNNIIEVKTTNSNEFAVSIKHDQIFNDDSIFISVIQIEENNSGMSLVNLVDYYMNNEPFKRNHQFQMNIERELRRVNYNEAKEKKYILKRFGIYKNKNIPTVENIPEFISLISYKYNFASINEENVSYFYKSLN